MNTIQPRHMRIRRSVPIETTDGRVFLKTFDGLVDRREHIAIVYERPATIASDLPTLVRVHSECWTGDTLGSEQCDCGAQLAEARRLCKTEGGCILYLRQEGRGIGLYAKIDAYALQRMGLDTFEANEALGLPHDARDYRVAADMLKALGFDHIRLLTNNPKKVRALTEAGIKVKVVGTGVFLTTSNVAYLQAKQLVTNHPLGLELGNIGRQS